MAEIVFGTAERLYDAFGTSLRSIVPRFGDDLFAQLGDEAFGQVDELWEEILSGIPLVSTALDLAQITLSVGQVVANGSPEDSDLATEQETMEPRPDDVAWLMERMKESLRKLLDDNVNEGMAELADLVRALPPAAAGPSAADEIARLLGEVRRMIANFSEQLALPLGSDASLRMDEADRVDSLLRTVAIGLLCAGTGGLTWHMAEKFRVRGGRLA